MTFRREGGACSSSTVCIKITVLLRLFNSRKLWNTGKFSIKGWTVNVSYVPSNPVYGRRLRHWNVKVGFIRIIVWFKWVSDSRFFMDVIVRSNNSPITWPHIWVSLLITCIRLWCIEIVKVCLDCDNSGLSKWILMSTTSQTSPGRLFL